MVDDERFHDFGTTSVSESKATSARESTSEANEVKVTGRKDRDHGGEATARGLPFLHGLVTKGSVHSTHKSGKTVLDNQKVSFVFKVSVVNDQLPFKFGGDRESDLVALGHS